jgi:hypothetical protein
LIHGLCADGYDGVLAGLGAHTSVGVAAGVCDAAERALRRTAQAVIDATDDERFSTGAL